MLDNDTFTSFGIDIIEDLSKSIGVITLDYTIVTIVHVDDETRL